jgi:hypothetical protein
MRSNRAQLNLDKAEVLLTSDVLLHVDGCITVNRGLSESRLPSTSIRLLGVIIDGDLYLRTHHQLDAGDIQLHQICVSLIVPVSCLSDHFSNGPS